MARIKAGQNKAKGKDIGAVEGAEKAAESQALKMAEASIGYITDALNSGDLTAEQVAKQLGVKIDTNIKKLPTKDGGFIEFLEIEIPQEQIESKTKISPYNPRPDHLLTDLELNSLVKVLDGYDQLDHAYGYFDSSGIINIVDGYCRSRANLLCKQPPLYRIWVAKDEMKYDDVLQLLKAIDYKLENPAYFSGKAWLRIKEEECLASYSQLADYLDQPLSTVKAYCQMAETDESYIKLLPYPASMGRSIAKALIKFSKQLSEEQFEDLKSYRDSVVSEVETKENLVDVTKKNSHMLKLLQSKVNELRGLAVSSSSTPEEFVLGVSGDVKVTSVTSINDQTGEALCKLKLTNVSAKKQKEFEKRLKDLVQDLISE